MLLGAVVPLFYNNRRLHLVQLAVNVVVLGLWTGTFVSYTLFMRIFAGGVSLSAIGALAAPLLMLIVALIYPLAGRSGHYCANICPFGSAQELAGKLSRRKLRITPRVLKLLSVLRNLLWGVHDSVGGQPTVGYKVDLPEVLVLNPANNAMALAQATVDLEFDGTSWKVTDCKGTIVDMKSTPIDEEFMAHFAPQIDEVNQWVKRPIGTLATTINSADCLCCVQIIVIFNWRFGVKSNGCCVAPVFCGRIVALLAVGCLVFRFL